MSRILSIFVCSLFSLLLISGTASAALKTKDIEYTSQDGAVMKGFLAVDTQKKSKKPAILIVHDWMGLGSFTKNKAKQLAKLGYVAFAVDIYGEDIRPEDTDEAAEMSTSYKSDRPLLRSHIRAAYDVVANMKEVDQDKIIVIGYCFGGTTALELARSGAPLIGTVSFHGGLATPTPQDAKNIKGRVLALHGADDPYVPPSEVAAFKQEMQAGGVDLTFLSYPGAVHAFTNPKAGNDKSKGIAYNEFADQASWQEFKQFLKEIVE